MQNYTSLTKTYQLKVLQKVKNKVNKKYQFKKISRKKDALDMIDLETKLILEDIKILIIARKQLLRIKTQRMNNQVEKTVIKVKKELQKVVT